MKHTEVIKLISLCSVNYRNFPEKDKEEATIALWSKMLADVDFDLAQAAIEKYMAESVYPPTVADIRARIADITAPRTKTAIEGWGDVLTAIRRYGMYNEVKAMESLKGVTKKVVASIGFRALCLSENEMADRAHFIKVYDTLANRERQESLLPLGTREMIEQIQYGMMRIAQKSEDGGKTA